MLLFIAANSYPLFKEGKVDSANDYLKRYNVNSNIIEPIWKFLDKHKNKHDLDLALWILNNDSNKNNRLIALTVLSNFDSQENVWWTLMNLQRDKDETLRLLATEILRNFIKKPISVNWEPVLPGIKHILCGTNLWAFTNTLEVLEKTNFSRTLNSQILIDCSHLIMSYLHAVHKPTREYAINFIQYLSNNYQLKDPLECEGWLKQKIN